MTRNAMSDATTLSKGLRSEHVPRLLRPFHVDDPLARPRPDHHDLTLLVARVALPMDDA